MTQINESAKEITAKLVYCGPGLSGKTTNLKMIHKILAPKDRGQLITMNTEMERTLFFDLLPLPNLPPINGFGLRYQLATVPGQIYYVAARRQVMHDADGIIFVADSAPDRLDATIESMEDVHRLLSDLNLDPTTIPMILQYNKRDLPGALSLDVMEGETLGLAELARELDVEMRFIEFMPLDSGGRWDRAHVVPSSETLAKIPARHPLEPLGRDDPSRTADTFRFRDGAPGLIGAISPVSAPFCGACSRLRITCDGKVLPCLFSRDGWDFRGLLRSGADDEQLEQLLIDATWTKQAGHGMSDAGFVRPERGMWEMGG